MDKIAQIVLPMLEGSEITLEIFLITFLLVLPLGLLIALLGPGLAGAAEDADWRAQLGSALKAPLELMAEPTKKTGEDLKAFEARLDAACVKPWQRVMGEAVDAAAEQLAKDPLPALDGLLPAAAEVDKGLARCIAGEGANGSASYVLDGRRLSAYAYVQRMRRLVAEMVQAAQTLEAEPPAAGPAPKAKAARAPRPAAAPASALAP